MVQEVTRTLYKARHVSVNCEENDPVDIRCGGPRMLGFDFYVDYDVPPQEIKDFITAELKKNGRSLWGNILISDTATEVRELWTRPMIAAEIKKGS